MFRRLLLLVAAVLAMSMPTLLASAPILLATTASIEAKPVIILAAP